MSAVRTAEFASVVDRFLEAALLPELLPHALHKLSEACGAGGAALHLSEGLLTLGTVGSEGIDELHDGFRRKWQAPELNSHRARGMDLIFRGWKGVLTEQDCFTPEELRRDLFHQDFFMRTGFSSFAGVILAKEGVSKLSTSIIRRADQEPYSREEIENINALAGQLQNIGHHMVRVGLVSSQRLADAFALSGQPIALLGYDGTVLHASPSFEQTVRGALAVKERRMASWHPDANQKLGQAVRSAIRRNTGLAEPCKPIVLPRRYSARPLIATIIPVVGNARDVFHMVAAVISVVDLNAEAPRPSVIALQQAFGFSPAEAKLAADIALGKTLLEIAAQSGVSKETLRSRLKSIFGKTATSRQSELALLLSRIPMGNSR
ncbi:helix-turn-helix transcriptional regulator [Bradyrhizobium genosp. A]|uniref:helix-turn-helix transcriptional regulator n=1 Tax=Bradyrhizobium genosp. A TaxID=83626 RepID=UPI003CF26142